MTKSASDARSLTKNLGPGRGYPEPGQIGQPAQNIGEIIASLCYDFLAGHSHLRESVETRTAHPAKNGAVAQLGERFNGIEEVEGSNPSSSTKRHCRWYTLRAETGYFQWKREGVLRFDGIALLSNDLYERSQD